MEEKGFPTLGTLIRLCMRIISSGTAICIVAATMANDNGLLKDGEEVVAVAGSWIGLDTAAVVRATNSVSLLKGEPCK